MHNRQLNVVFMLSILCLILIPPIPTQVEAQTDDLSGVNVAIYRGTGVMSSSWNALTRMFLWMNATVANVTSLDIKNGSLEEFDILVVPGGSETTASSDLDSEGRQMIRDYVKHGGSYFGICGGATFGARYLGFFRGYMSPLNEPGSIIHLTSMQVNQSCVGPDLSECSENFSTMYYASQYFVPNTAVDAHVVATYEYNGEAGMVAFEHENGTVFLSSPHPEYEEMSDRDNTSFGSDLEDPDSEWDMLLQVSKWLVEASYVEPSESSDTITNSEGVDQILTFLGISSVGIAAVVILATIVIRRR